MLSKIALAAVIVLSVAFSASAATKHHHVTHVRPAFITYSPALVGGGCPANGGPGCSTSPHHQIAGDDVCVGSQLTSDALPCRSFESATWVLRRSGS
jgi:hypothetical protein